MWVLLFRDGGGIWCFVKCFLFILRRVFVFVSFCGGRFVFYKGEKESVRIGVFRTGFC